MSDEQHIWQGFERWIKIEVVLFAAVIPVVLAIKSPGVFVGLVLLGGLIGYGTRLLRAARSRRAASRGATMQRLTFRRPSRAIVAAGVIWIGLIMVGGIATEAPLVALGILVVGFGIALAVGSRRARRRSRQAAEQCTDCGYPMRGLGPICPECGGVRDVGASP